MWTRKQLKTDAKAAFKQNYWRCVLVALVFVLLIGVTAGLSGSGSGAGFGAGVGNIGAIASGNETIDKAVENFKTALDEANGMAPDKAATKVSEAVQNLFDEIGDEGVAAIGAIILTLVISIIVGSIISMIISVVISIFLRNPLQVSCYRFFYKNTEDAAKLGEMKYPFGKGRYMKTVGAMLLKDLFIFLWSLLFIIPGIIKAYDYRLVGYILADDPTMSAKEALKKSKEMMKGNRWKAFVLDLSFILWWFLAGIPFVGMFVALLYVYPYICQTDAELYRTLKANNN